VGFLGVGFLGGCTPQKTYRFFWVRTQVSEPCCHLILQLLQVVLCY